MWTVDDPFTLSPKLARCCLPPTRRRARDAQPADLGATYGGDCCRLCGFPGRTNAIIRVASCLSACSPSGVFWSSPRHLHRRFAAGTDKHVSEKPLPDHLVDHEFTNRGTMDELVEMVLAALW